MAAEGHPTRVSSRPRPSRARVVVASVIGSAAALATIAAACLPDLDALPTPDGPDAPETPPLPLDPPFPRCGDGVVATLDDGGDAGESCDPGEAGVATPGCETCRVTCDGFVDPASGHCFFDAGATTSYATAFARCDEEGAHLATFASAREAAILGDAGVWIGLESPPSVRPSYLSVRADEPGWPCPGCFALPADGGETFPSLGGGAPEGECVASLGGAWYAVPCSTEASPDGGDAPIPPLVALCEREPVGRRGQGCGGAICFTLPATAGTKTYVLFATPALPDDARAACASYSGGALVLLDSAEEREQLAREVVKFLRDEAAAPSVTTTLWIGLAFDAATAAWRWDDGRPIADRPDPWAKDQPDGVGAGRAFLRMRDRQVDTQLAVSDDKRAAATAARPFVCQRAP